MVRKNSRSSEVKQRGQNNLIRVPGTASSVSNGFPDVESFLRDMQLVSFADLNDLRVHLERAQRERMKVSNMLALGNEDRASHFWDQAMRWLGQASKFKIGRDRLVDDQSLADMDIQWSSNSTSALAMFDDVVRDILNCLEESFVSTLVLGDGGFCLMDYRAKECD